MRNQRRVIAGICCASVIGIGAGFALGLPTSASAARTAATIGTDSTGTTDATPTSDHADNDSDQMGHMGHDGPGHHGWFLQQLVDDGTITAAQRDSIIAAAKAAVIGNAGAAGDPSTLLSGALAALVTDRTITQAQADAVTAAISEFAGFGGFPGGPGGFDGPGGFGGFGSHDGFGDHGHRGVSLDVAATALGMTADELKVELQAGKTIADVATAKGVKVQAVIDALVAEQTANITARITDAVNGVAPTPPNHYDATTSTTTG